MKRVAHRVEEMRRLGFDFAEREGRVVLVHAGHGLQHVLTDNDPASAHNNAIYDKALQENKRCSKGAPPKLVALLDALLPAWREHYHERGSLPERDRLFVAYKAAHVRELMDAVQRCDGITLHVGHASDDVWELMDARGKEGLGGAFGSDGARPICLPAPYAAPGKKHVMQMETLLEKLLLREGKTAADEPCLAPARRISAVAEQLLHRPEQSL